MVILELCGLPGAGKSTLISEYLHTARPDNIKTRSDLYPGNRFYNYGKMRFDFWRFDHGMYNPPNSRFDRILKIFPNASTHSKVRIMDLYKRLWKNKKDNAFFLLEEGPAQYFSALSYNEYMINDNTICDYWDMFEGIAYYPIVCECSYDVCIDRLINRKKTAAFYDPSNSEIKRLLDVKYHNIINVLSFSGKPYTTLNMELDIRQNVQRLSDIIYSNCNTD